MTISLDASSSAHGRSWPALAEQLLAEFPEAAITDIVRELREARDGVQHLSVAADEAIDLAEVVVRNQLNLLTGRIADVARLKPESHQRSAAAADR